MTKADELIKKRIELNKAFSDMNEKISISIPPNLILELKTQSSINMRLGDQAVISATIDKRNALIMAHWVMEMFGDK